MEPCIYGYFICFNQNHIWKSDPMWLGNLSFGVNKSSIPLNLKTKKKKVNSFFRWVSGHYEILGSILTKS